MREEGAESHSQEKRHNGPERPTLYNQIMTTRSYTFVRPPVGQLYADVLAAGLESATMFYRIAPALLDWMNPELPDDPHLLRHDETTWLGSTTTEQDAWLELSDAEWEVLNRRWPIVIGAVRRDEPPPDNTQT